jgi:hypothetical protein
MRLVRLSYLAPDITKAILDGRQPGDFDGREAPRALPSAACLALISGSCSALLERDPNLKIYRFTARQTRLHDQPHRGTGISPDRDIAAG